MNDVWKMRLQWGVVFGKINNFVLFDETFARQ